MIFDQFSPALLVGAILALTVVAPWVARSSGKGAGALLALVPFSVFGILLSGSAVIWKGTPWRGDLSWAPELGIDWNLWISPVGLLLGLLVSGIGTLIVLYAGSYLEGSPKRSRFFGALFLFMGAMMGLAVTENLVVFFVFWELTSVASYLLIGHYHEKGESRKSALDALLVTGGGDVALLAGVILLGEAGGSYLIGELVANQEVVVAHPLYPAIFICLLIGAVTKSAQVPFHFWLPGAMAAPAPVSAYLHSATMVKAGVFLLALLHPILGGTDLWHFTLMAIGTVTMTWGALVAVVQTDLKRLLAFTTVSALGTLVMLLGIESELAVKAAVVFLVVHALYKGALFMVAGILEKTTGTREVEQLRGLMRSLPILGMAAVMGAASMSGIPPFVGFIAKELLYEVKLEAPIVGWPLLICGFVANAANIIVALKVGVAPFLGTRGPATPVKKRADAQLVAGSVVLGCGSLVMGLFPGAILGDALNAVVGQIRAETVMLKLKLWHGLNLVFLLSVLTVGTGVVGYLFRKRLRAWGRIFGAPGRGRWNARDLFRAGLAGLLAGAGKVTSALQSGDLRQYFLAILLTGIGLAGWAFFHTGHTISLTGSSAVRLEVAMAVGLVVTATVLILRARARSTAILGLGCVGFGIAGLFALYGAPDLAITQLLVETLTLVLFALAIHGLPALQRSGFGAGQRWVTTGIAAVVGVGFALLTLKALTLELHEPVSREMAQRSLPEAFGRNVVNVILVDFRALDTLGEIAVLVIAALGVSAMLGRPNRDRRPGLDEAKSSVLPASARFTAPAMIVFSLYLLLRGHNEPGGGFIGGLVAALAALLTHLASPERSLRLFRLGPEMLASVGLALAVGSGLPGLGTRGSFLAAEWGPEWFVPAVGKVKLGTPLVFDVGVYLVVAAIVLILYQQLQRWHSHRPAGPGSRLCLASSFIMEIPLSLLIGLLAAAGVYLILQRNLFRILLGLALLAQAANLLVFAAAGLGGGEHAIIAVDAEQLPADHPDPLAQALVLTAIVISFGVLAFCLTLLKLAHRRSGKADITSLTKSGS